MAKFNIQAGSEKVIGGVKTAVKVTFKADDGRTATCYHEAESVDKDFIEQELQKAADDFEAHAPVVVAPAGLETGKDLEVAIKE